MRIETDYVHLDGERRLTYKVTVPCKVNLYLKVLGKREDGYHELDTIMLGVSLTDSMQLIPSESPGWKVELSFENPQRFDPADPAWDVPSDERNLVVRALQLLATKLGKEDVGGLLRLHKSIPAMAGLGGGSANAAGALLLGFAAWGNPEQWPIVVQCAAQLGSDINFFLEGANADGYWVARCRGRGERIEPLPGDLGALALVLVHPPAGCSTSEVFRRLKAAQFTSNLQSSALQADRVLDSNQAVESLQKCLADGNAIGVGHHLYNALLEPAAEVTDWISRAGSWIDRYDHFGQTLSGSGSARFCLCSSWEQAEIIERELRSLNMVRAFAVRPWHQSRLQDQMQAIKGLSQ